MTQHEHLQGIGGTKPNNGLESVSGADAAGLNVTASGFNRRVEQ